MFSQLGDKLQEIFKDLRGHGKISEENIDAALRQIRLALLAADVDFQVAKNFIARVKEKALGEAVLRSITPGQQVVKIFYDELSILLGGDAAPLELGKQIDVPVFTPDASEKNVQRAAAAAIASQDRHPTNIEIFDTAGRQEIDAALIEELKELKEFLQPQETLLVVDAATGQQAVSVATHFNDALEVTGIILTKLDGDARGGAVLSMREVTQRPIKFVGTGERLDQFEAFVPERLAGRILGMGDVVGLVEKAAETIEIEDAERLERKLRSASFDFNDFLGQFKMLRKMGPLENVLGMLPGMSNVQGLSIDEKQLKRTEAIVLSMTSEERTRPEILNARRRQRIARGSGSTVTEVNDLIRRFDQMKKMMKNAGKMKKMMAQMARMKK